VIRLHEYRTLNTKDCLTEVRRRGYDSYSTFGYKREIVNLTFFFELRHLSEGRGIIVLRLAGTRTRARAELFDQIIVLTT